MEGLLVVAVEQAVAAPMCSVRLADAGARVIKVERAGGETARHYDRTVDGISAYFAWLNRGKQSIMLDFKDEADLALLKRMIGRADIFIQNLAPGATGRLGIGSDALVELWPSLIAIDIVGYRQDSAYRNMRAYDLLVQAETGLCAITGTSEEPCKVGVSVADIATGMNAHAAILEALLERAQTGRGRSIEVAMFDCLADWMSVPLAHYDHGGQITPRTGLNHASIYPYASFRCADGELVIVVQNPDEWRRFSEQVLMKPELVTDPRFRDNPARVANRTALAAIIEVEFAAFSQSEAIERLEKARLAWARISSVEDLSNHPALRRLEVPVPGGAYRGVASPIRSGMKSGPVPALDEHGPLIRAEFA